MAMSITPHSIASSQTCPSCFSTLALHSGVLQEGQKEHSSVRRRRLAR
ncbi:MAG TPA: hypothetical protein VL461_15775 [Dictyobacter sp.]|nr:hypothetical protein [Dictyobacter sp.]